jgi:hypothetical protein
MNSCTRPTRDLVAVVTTASSISPIVLERGYTSGYGNTARLYRVRLDPSAASTMVSQLGEDRAPLAKELLADLSMLPA